MNLLKEPGPGSTLDHLGPYRLGPQNHTGRLMVDRRPPPWDTLSGPSLSLAVLCQARDSLSTLGIFVNYNLTYIFDKVKHMYSTKFRMHKRIESKPLPLLPQHLAPSSAS